MLFWLNIHRSCCEFLGDCVKGRNTTAARIDVNECRASLDFDG